MLSRMAPQTQLNIKKLIEVFAAGVYRYTYLIVISPFMSLPFYLKKQ